MTLADKIKLLRTLEGNLRGLDRALTKSEVARLILQELGVSVSQAYLSQLETGKREHMTAKTRELLARFFKVHPGYLVGDPEGYATRLSTPQLIEARLDELLRDGADALAIRDPELADALRTLAASDQTRDAVILMAELADHPGAVARLRAALAAPASPASAPPSQTDSPGAPAAGPRQA